MAPSAAVAPAAAASLPTGKASSHVTTSTHDADDSHATRHANLEMAEALINRLNTAFASGEAEQVADLFRDDGWLKDLLVTTWDYRAPSTKPNIVKFLKENGFGAKKTVSNFVLEPESVADNDSFPGIPWLMGFFRFETNLGRGRGVFRLHKDGSSQPKLHALFLGLEELKGFEERKGAGRIRGTEYGEDRGGATWLDKRDRKREFLDEEPAVAIIGAGQSGLMLAYRLGQLNVPTVILDRNPRIGDNWRNRYKSLVLHDPVWYDHFPGMPFPEHWPIYTAKDKLANWMESYAETMELNAWMGTNIDSSSFDESKGRWTLDLTRADGKKRTIHPQHICLATGHSGEPNIPTFKGQEKFKGPMVHSSQFTSGDKYQGKVALVVGSNNSGQDLSVNLCENKWEVIQHQRSSTYVMSVRAVEDVLLKGLYSQDGPSTEDADLIFNSSPNPIHLPVQKVVAEKMATGIDKDIIAKLKKAGFNWGKGVGDAGFLYSYYSKGGGYYLATGSEDFIADGRIKMKQGVEIDHIKEDGVVFADGSEVKCDLIVLATGYKNMRTSAIKILGEKEGGKFNPVWGLDDEGELRVAWRPTGHSNAWVQCGNLALNRWHSKKLALQIKARLEGLA